MVVEPPKTERLGVNKLVGTGGRVGRGERVDGLEGGRAGIGERVDGLGGGHACGAMYDDMFAPPPRGGRGSCGAFARVANGGVATRPRLTRPRLSKGKRLYGPTVSSTTIPELRAFLGPYTVMPPRGTLASRRLVHHRTTVSSMHPMMATAGSARNQSAVAWPNLAATAGGMDQWDPADLKLLSPLACEPGGPLQPRGSRSEVAPEPLPGEGGRSVARPLRGLGCC